MIDPRFQRVELELARLKEEVAAGKITADAFARAIESQTLEAGGRFWALGVNTGKWYVSDGDTWTEAPPPQVVEPSNVPAPPPVAPAHPHLPPQPRPAAAVPPTVPSTGKGTRPQQWILGCGMGCLAPLLILGGIAHIVWSRSNYTSTQFGSAGVCFGVFVAAICAVPLLPRIPFLLFLGAAVFWTIIGFLMQTTGFGYNTFGWYSGSIAWFSGMAAVVGVILGLGVRKMVVPR